LDTERCFVILAPVVAVGAAVVFDRLWKEHHAWAFGLLTVPLAEFASAQAYRTGSKDLRLLVFCSVPAVICVAYAFWACIAQMREGLHMHAAAIRKSVAEIATG
jgi:hypothetical protein